LHKNNLLTYIQKGGIVCILEKEVTYTGGFLHDHALTPRTKDEKQAVINRLRRIESQIPGIHKMVEEDRYCPDILVQINAINAALNKVGFSVAERHAKHCVSHAIKSGEGDPAIDELLDVIKQFSK